MASNNDKFVSQADEFKLEDQFGVYQVWSGSLSAKIVNTDNGKTVKKFKGETAWSDAVRWAGDKALSSH